MIKKYLIGLLVTVVLFSCKNESNSNDESDNKESDNLSLDIASNDLKEISNDTLNSDIEVVDKKTEQKENHKKIVEKYGEQWDFCTCVVKGDSVNKALENASEEYFDFLLDRSDYIENKCKELMAKDLKTPEDRQKHKAKVARCLR